MNQQVPRALPTEYLSRLVDVMNPHRPQLDATHLEAQITCGRWLAYQRQQLGLAPDTVAARTLLNERTLLLLETGMAKHEMLSPLARTLLVNILAPAGRTPAFIEQVVEVAAANWTKLNDTLLDQIWKDLSASKPVFSTETQNVQHEEEPVMTAPTRPSREPASLSKIELAILKVLDDGVPRTFVAIDKAVSAAYKLAGSMAISLALDALVKQALVGNSEQALQLFEVTPEGRLTLQAAERSASEEISAPDASDQTGTSGPPWQPKGAL